MSPFLISSLWSGALVAFATSILRTRETRRAAGTLCTAVALISGAVGLLALVLTLIGSPLPGGVVALFALLLGVAMLLSPQQTHEQLAPKKSLDSAAPEEDRSESRSQLSSKQIPPTSNSDSAGWLASWPIAAARADAAGHITWCNEAWARCHGLTPAQALGKLWAEFHPEDDMAHRISQLFECLHAQGHSTAVLDRLGESGSVWTSTTFATQLPDGVWMVALEMDADEARFRLRVRESGHKLNNLLSAVVGNVGLALGAGGLDAETRDDLGEAERSAMTAAELIRQLQHLARGES